MKLCKEIDDALFYITSTLNRIKNESKILEKELDSAKNQIKQLNIELYNEKQEKEKLKLENDRILKYGKFITLFS
jgi:predicted  nucleic acid-binding Zn-ribbon protein